MSQKIRHQSLLLRQQQQQQQQQRYFYNVVCNYYNSNYIVPYHQYYQHHHFCSTIVKKNNHNHNHGNEITDNLLWKSNIVEGSITDKEKKHKNMISKNVKYNRRHQAINWLTQNGIKASEVSYYQEAINAHIFTSSGTKNQIQIFEDMLQIDKEPIEVVIYNMIIKDKSFRRSSHEECIQWYEKMLKENLTPTIFTYNTLLKAFGFAGDKKKMIKYLTELQKAGLQPNHVTFNTFMKFYINTDEPWKAIEVFHELLQSNNQKQNLVMYNTVINACSKAGVPNKGIELFEKMQENGIKPDIITYTSIIAGFADIGNVERTVFWFDQIPSDVKPDVNVYNSVLKGFSEIRQPDKVEEWHQKMIEDGITPSATTFNIIMNAYLKMIRFPTISSSPPSSLTTTNSIDDLNDNLPKMNLEYKRKIIQWFKQMLSYQNTNEFTRDFSYQNKMINKQISSHIIVSMYAKSGEPDVALTKFKEFISKGTKPSTSSFNIIMNSFCKMDNFLAASELFQEMAKVDIKPDSSTYSTLISQLLKNEDIDQAIVWFNSMINEDVVPTNKIYNMFIRYFELLKRNSKSDDEIDSSLQIWYNDMLYYGVNNGIINKERAVSALRNLHIPDKKWLGLFQNNDHNSYHKNESNNYNNIKPKDSSHQKVSDIKLYNKMIYQALVVDNDMNQAIEHYDKLIAAKIDPDNKTFNMFTEAYLKMGNVEEALKWFNMMTVYLSSPSSPAIYVSSYEVFIDGFSHRNHRVEASKWFEKMITHRFRVGHIKDRILGQGIKDLIIIQRRSAKDVLSLISSNKIGRTLDKSMYEIAYHSFLQAKMYKEARIFYDELILERGITLNSRAMTIALEKDIFCQSIEDTIIIQRKKARDILELLSLNKHITSLDISFYNIALESFMKAEMHREAISLYELLDSDFGKTKLLGKGRVIKNQQSHLLFVRALFNDNQPAMAIKHLKDNVFNENISVPQLWFNHNFHRIVRAINNENDVNVFMKNVRICTKKYGDQDYVTYIKHRKRLKKLLSKVTDEFDRKERARNSEKILSGIQINNNRYDTSRKQIVENKKAENILKHYEKSIEANKISSNSKAKDVENIKDALTLYESLIKANQIPNLDISRKAMTACVNCNPNKVFHIYKQIVKNNPAKDLLDTKIFITLMQAEFNINQKDEERLLLWFDKMIAAKINPDIDCYNFILKAYIKNGKIEKATSWFSMINFSGLTPNEESYALLINGLLLKDEKVKAAEWFKKATSAGMSAKKLQMFNVRK